MISGELVWYSHKHPYQIPSLICAFPSLHEVVPAYEATQHTPCKGQHVPCWRTFQIDVGAS